jgi:hypothetical protein
VTFGIGIGGMLRLSVLLMLVSFFKQF